MSTLTIDVVSDVACPWCVIGYKHLEQALEQLNGELSVDLTWHAFELRRIRHSKAKTGASTSCINTV